MKPPSTAWKEDVAADEAMRFQGYADQLTAIQRRRSEKLGPGRALHRKQLLAAAARFEVLPGLPAHAAHGLFAKPATYDAVVRFSNASHDTQSDRAPDVRGYAFRVKGVSGEGCFGAPTTNQDFTLINREAFGTPKTAPFIAMIVALADGPPALIKHFIKTMGFFAGLKKVKQLLDSTKAPFHGFANERFHSAAPIACGPYAVRVRLLPASTEKDAAARDDWGKDVARRLAKGALTHEIQLQFFVDEATTPVEDASVNWPESAAPWLTVAKLTLEQQDIEGPAGKTLAADVEAGVIDPWNALLAHRPLGDVMRARKVIYFASEEGRKAQR
ncbi:MAG: catalase [Deltaproteobacteria bacterium]|nr:catalase [Deltaproteobacteria bacterium]